VIGCPECQSPLYTSICRIRSCRQRALFNRILVHALTLGLHDPGPLISWFAGERVSCQQCGHIYSIGPKGTFRHDLKALPYMGNPQKPQEGARQPVEPQGMLPPKPRARPVI